jgi:choice-of-anchor B domain-containing protein
MKLRMLLATGVAMLAMTATASAHPLPGGFSLGNGLSIGWMDPDEAKLRGLTTAKTPPPWSNSPESFKPCVRGMAGEFPCDNVHLLSHLPLANIGGGDLANDMWGWKDPQTGREYALVGRSNGTAFIDVTDPRRARYIGNLPTQVSGSRDSWRDIKVYEDHAFVVSEHIGHGMQVFDLTRLRDVQRGTVETFDADTVYTGVSNTHNLDINTESGFAYLVGTNTCGNGGENGGLHMVDISEPTSPEFAGCATVPLPAPGQPNNNYVHDSQCVNYDGPDADYQGREICFGSNENAVIVYDVTDKANPEIISETTYATAVYTHQGWLTPDSKWFLFNDEGDENGFGDDPTVDRQTTYITNAEDLDDLGEVMASENNTTSIDHNLYMSGDGYVRESNYTSGLRVFTEKSVPTGDLDEVAWFDVYPENDNATFEGGTWSNYQFDKGYVGVSSIDRGFFLLDPKPKKKG